MSNSRFGQIWIWPGTRRNTDTTRSSCRWIKSGHRSFMWPTGQSSSQRYEVESRSPSRPAEWLFCGPSRIRTTMKHSSRDLLVDSNGTVKHNVIISAAVNCEVNLFNYPFAADECPVAIQTWTKDGEQGRVKSVAQCLYFSGVILLFGVGKFWKAAKKRWQVSQNWWGKVCSQ